ncbi:MAG: PA14 domain-containing protein, partial [Planctomycetes bacterium]|nr:PA14 domain-containing protein [Planctomycetota bacterium]
ETEPVGETSSELEAGRRSDPDKSVSGQSDGSKTRTEPPSPNPAGEPPPPPRPSPLLVKGKAKHQNVGNRRPRAHKISKGVGIKKLAVATDKLKQDRRGLFAKYYRFNAYPISVLIDPANPELDDRNPDIIRIDRQVSFPNKEAVDDLPFDKGNFMAVWTGFLVIEKSADYWLFLGCDLHGRVELGGQTILLNEVRDYSEVTTVVKLEPGLHPLRIEYVESKNGSVVEALGSCNFMWVPEGKSKPEPVPAKMLLLPEELWSDDAPIITHLSTTHGKIGDEITIYGQGLAETKEQKEDKYASAGIEVTFAGQIAEVISATPNKVKVMVPIGAKTGRLQILKTTYKQWYSSPVELEDGSVLRNPVPIRFPSSGVPSNSIDFTVTNQFGLIANWHNLEGWSHFDFIEPGVREPEVTQLENPPTFESRDDLNLEFKQNPMACIWTGKLGIPANWHENTTKI